MRLAPCKTALIVNDHVGNCLVHGLPETEIGWTLAGVEKQHGDAPVWRCDSCGVANSRVQRACQACASRGGVGHRRSISMAAGELAEITTERLTPVRDMTYGQLLGAMLSEAELREYARARGYHPWWVRHRLREQERGGA